MVLFLPLLVICSCSEKVNTRPNILLIVTDDQSWEHLGCYEDMAIRTPNVDRLAEEGVRFKNAYAASPSCSPSRAGILTGQDIYRLQEGGVLTGFIRDEYEVFPELLEQAGYVIGYTGKGYWPRTADVKGAIAEPFGKNYRMHFYDSVAPGLSRINYSANFEQFLDDNVGGKPFFFLAGTGEPHRPYGIDRGMETGIDTSLIRLPAFFPDVPDSKLDMADYMAEIEWADRVVGELVEILESNRLMENTLIIFTSDNGMPFPRRAIHTEEWTYIINYEPDRYPMGNADIFIPNWDILGETDPGRLKTYFKQNMSNPGFKYFRELAFGKVPGEELYNKYDDPDMINNLAGHSGFRNIKEELCENLEEYLKETNDPRMNGLSPWDEYKLDK